MKIFFGILSLLIVTIEIQGSTKIEIFEIRDKDNGLEIKNMNSKYIKKPDPFLKLLRGPKSDEPEKSERTRTFVKQLLSKLNALRGEEKMKRFNDDARIYILSGDDFHTESVHEETPFLDNTRNDRATNNIDTNEIRDLLLRLLQKSDSKKPFQKKRKLRHNLFRKPVLRADYEDIAQSRTRPRQQYKYDRNDDGVENDIVYL